jgi:hypothetical protein
VSDTPIEAPTRQEIRDEIGFAFVRDAVEAACGGEYVTKVFRREYDNTYWQVCYFISDDGYVNGLHDSEYCNPAEITHVYPVEVVAIKYIPVESN